MKRACFIAIVYMALIVVPYKEILAYPADIYRNIQDNTPMAKVNILSVIYSHDLNLSYEIEHVVITFYFPEHHEWLNIIEDMPLLYNRMGRYSQEQITSDRVIMPLDYKIGDSEVRKGNISYSYSYPVRDGVYPESSSFSRKILQENLIIIDKPVLGLMDDFQSSGESVRSELADDYGYLSGGNEWIDWIIRLEIKILLAIKWLMVTIAG